MKRIRGSLGQMSLRARSVVIALAVVAVASVVVARWAGSPTAGPLSCPDCGREGVRFSVEVSEPFTWGMVPLMNGGDKPAVIDSVRLVNPTPGLEVTSVYGVSKGVREAFSRVDPNRTFGSRLQPLEGFVVPGPADGQYTIAIGLNAPRLGAYRVSAVDVSYHVGSTSYVWRADELLTVCAIASSTPEAHRCTAPYPLGELST